MITPWPICAKTCLFSGANDAHAKFRAAVGLLIPSINYFAHKYWYCTRHHECSIAVSLVRAGDQRRQFCYSLADTNKCVGRSTASCSPMVRKTQMSFKFSMTICEFKNLAGAARAQVCVLLTLV
jgi:hypothetical protein